MFISVAITAAKAIVALPAYDVAGLSLLGMFGLVLLGFLVWAIYEMAAAWMADRTYRRRRSRRRASYWRRYGVRR